jgi:hypothetical protein
LQTALTLLRYSLKACDVLVDFADERPNRIALIDVRTELALERQPADSFSSIVIIVGEPVIDDFVDPGYEQLIAVGPGRFRRGDIRIAAEDEALARNDLPTLVVSDRRSQLLEVDLVVATQLLSLRHAGISIEFQQVGRGAVSLDP